MATRDPEKRRKHYRDWYYRNAGRQNEYNWRRRSLIRNWFADLKKTLRCARCGEDHPAVLDFQHRTADEILSEIAKCDVLRANCHRKLHWSEDIDDRTADRATRMKALDIPVAKNDPSHG